MLCTMAFVIESMTLVEKVARAFGNASMMVIIMETFLTKITKHVILEVKVYSPFSFPALTIFVAIV